MYNHSFYSQNSAQEFVKEALAHLDRKVQKAPYIPFKGPYLNNLKYQHMNVSQQKYYFYWRKELDSGTYLATDLGYFFLHVNEVINLIGFKDAQSAYERLVNIWQYYRKLLISEEQYRFIYWIPNEGNGVRIDVVDYYLIDWIADFLSVHKLSISALEWYMYAVSQGAVLIDRRLFVYSWILNGVQNSQTPIDVIFCLANYFPSRNKFYQDYRLAYDLDQIYKNAIASIIHAVEAKPRKIKPLLVQMNKPYTIERYPFSGAFYNGSVSKIQISDIPVRINYKKLSINLRSVIKYVENIFRIRARFRAKLRDIEIFPEWKAILDDTFAPELEPIAINWTYAEQLKKQSMDTRARLIVDEDEQEEEEPAQERSSYHISEELEVKQGNIRILTLLRSYEWMASASALQKLYEDQFIQIVVDRLNEWAYEMFGDVIVVQEGDYYSLLEEYREDIVTLLDKLS